MGVIRRTWMTYALDTTAYPFDEFGDRAQTVRLIEDSLTLTKASVTMTGSSGVLVGASTRTSTGRSDREHHPGHPLPRISNR